MCIAMICMLLKVAGLRGHCRRGRSWHVIEYGGLGLDYWREVHVSLLT